MSNLVQDVPSLILRGSSQMDAWQANGRVVLFGFTGLVHNFSQEQLREYGEFH